jgi:hypothetical protein
MLMIGGPTIPRKDVRPWPGVAKFFTLAQWLATLALTGETHVRFLVMSLSVLT